MQRSGIVFVVTAALVSTVSCRPADRLGFTPVEGRVTFDGQPLERGEIRFAPDSAAGTTGPQSVSPLSSGGAFALRGPGGRLGAVPGQHRVYLAMPIENGPPTPPIEIDGTFVDREEAVQPSPGARKVPGRYLAPETSGLIATITRGEPGRFDFDLVSTPQRK